MLRVKRLGYHVGDINNMKRLMTGLMAFEWVLKIDNWKINCQIYVTILNAALSNKSDLNEQKLLIKSF